MMNSIRELMPKHIRSLVAYESARSLNIKGNVFLDANELPWSFDDKAYNRYPTPQPQDLLRLMADYYQVKSDQIILGRGSDEAIDLLLRCFCQAGVDAIITCPPTYGMYDVSAKIQDVSHIEIPLVEIENKSFQINTSEVIKKLSENVKLIFLCSPNNPTGNLLDPDSVLQITKMAQGKALVVVDEAYIEFSNSKSLCNLIQENLNLVILRTLSKAHGLAGLRTGVAIAQIDIISALNKVRAPYPVPTPILDILKEYFTSNKIHKCEENIQLILSERQHFVSQLKQMNIVEKIYPSETNFVLVKFKNANHIMQNILAAGIIIRDRGRQLNLHNCIRITIGSKEQNALLLKLLKEQDS